MEILRKGLLSLTFVLVCVAFLLGSDDETSDPTISGQALMTTIKSYGYQMEEHFVTTSDGYILSIYRILPKSGSQRRNRPVFLGHCLMSSGASYLQSPDSLAYLLSDKGFDVWIPHLRGTAYSRNHTSLDSCRTCRSYWDFGLEESALFDYPASIDYILNETRSDQVDFVGFSMGGTHYLMLLALKPEYNDKINFGVLLAPLVFGSKVQLPFYPNLIKNNYKRIFGFMNFLNLHVVDAFPNHTRQKFAFFDAFCNIGSLFSTFCR